ncbi:MAG TPA: formate--tetrahydrofolate ligase [candidate division WOR-3 bacterium]|uniref:Formate--tetrahydrofolate ligase n=1 Tax=candidate division WOR-3 bacterium TaxID=2052148 RepID=A0A7V0XG63_UNCW3|nr:formate--tetrahydrofolate ligase [candidate division WOR-3 bacterium]
MLSDIEIAHSVKLKPICEIVQALGIEDMDLVLPNGNFKAKLSLRLLDRLADRPEGKLVLVTATTPTRYGEGKTTVSVGLSMALNRLGKKSAVVLREPSLGPVFGIKGGAAGGGFSQVLPMEDINLHFTGDIHAVGAAHNLLAALLDNSIHFDNPLRIDEREIFFPRTMDMNDRVLRTMVVGLGGRANGPAREDGFVITAASEVMAILGLSASRQELKERLGRILVAMSYDDKPVTAETLGGTGAMAVLLKDALKPNVVQTIEHTPAFVHAGPFANIAHGTASVVATKMARRLSEYTVIEAGFGSDLGAEKFVDIVAPAAGWQVATCVLVTTIRALRHQGGARDARKGKLTDLWQGMNNLLRHIEICRTLGLEPVVAVNRFADDSEDDLRLVRKYCAEHEAACAVSEGFARGSEGCVELAEAVVRQAEERPSEIRRVYELKTSIEEKIETVATKVYGADRVVFTPRAEREIRRAKALGFDHLPVCIAKTPSSLSDDPALVGATRGFRVAISAVNVSAGAGFLVPVAGDMMLMPGLAKRPNATGVDMDEDGRITGLS